MFAAMTDTAQTLRDMVREFLDLTGIAPSRLSKLSDRSPGYIARFLKGRMPRLDTADFVLKAMGFTAITERRRTRNGPALTAPMPSHWRRAAPRVPGRSMPARCCARCWTAGEGALA